MKPKTPKPTPPPAAPPPAPDMEEVNNLQYTERDKDAENAEMAVAGKRRGRKALRINMQQPTAQGGSLNIPR